LTQAGEDASPIELLSHRAAQTRYNAENSFFSLPEIVAMTSRIDRRSMLKTGAAWSAAAGLANLGWVGDLPRVAAEETKLDPKIVRLDSGIEPLVQLLETTPRDQLLEEVGGRIQKGTLNYRELLAALLLAGVRNVEPRPSVGFKFHCVLVVNSAHLASLSSPDEHRWLPLFWALDYFKSAQAADERERHWTMAPVDEAAVPTASKAHQTFLDAMENWNEPAADAAVAGLARNAGLNEIYEMFFRLGVRDLRSIGHKSIFVANSYRTLQCIGREHAEPVLRSLAYALLNHEGDNPSKRDDETDRPYRRNSELVKKIRAEWLEGKPDEAATTSLLATLRTGSSNDACDQVVELLNKGVSPQSIWDAIFVEAGELLMRQPAIVALHSVTTTNAVHFAYQTAADDETRRLLLLQNAAYLPMFREQMTRRGKVADLTIDSLKPADEKGVTPQQVFETLGKDRKLAAEQALAVLHQGGKAEELIDAARVLIFLKGTDSHDYKFSSAVLEDYAHISPRWRDTYLASNLFNLRSANEKDNSLVQRAKAALNA
jgi:hypothetical protein